MNDDQLIEVKRYIHEVMSHIHGPAPERERIETDLRAHIQEASERGEPAKSIIERMGSPTELATEFMSQMPLRYAGFWWRLAAYSIDTLVIVLAAAMLSLPAGLLINRVPRNPVGMDWAVGAILIALFTGLVLAVIGIVVLYFPILEARFGQTAGKRWLGLRVLKENGLPIGYKEAFLRRLSYYFEILPVDALFIPFNAKRQRAFDLVARTVVIRETEDKRMRPLLALTLIVALPLALLCACIRPQVGQITSSSTPSGHSAYNFQSFTGIERSDMPGQGGQSIRREYQATVGSGSLTIKVENPQGQVVWEAAPPAGEKSSRASQVIGMNQGGYYVIVVEGREAEGSLDLSWQNIR